jgi:hypothetical protein
VNKQGQILLLQFDGDENVRGYGADLAQMAKYFIKYGDILHAVNLDGGSSDSVMIQGVTVNAPMEPCHNHPAPAPYCQRPVATVLCFRQSLVPSSSPRTSLVDVPVMNVDAAGEIRDVYYLLPRIGLLCVIAVAVLAYVIGKTRSSHLNDVRVGYVHFAVHVFAKELRVTPVQVPLQDFSRFGSLSVSFDTQETSQLISSELSISSCSRLGKDRRDDDL